MSVDRPDFIQSRAILIGTSTYTHLPQISAASSSLREMKSLLTGPLCGWPESQVTEFENIFHPSDLLTQLSRLIRETKDVLIFYYVGHGMPTLYDDLCMGLVDTSTDADEIEYTGLLMSQVRKMLSASQARVKVVILDCCFSGIVTENRQATENQADYIAGLARVRGAYTLTASDAHMPARFGEGRNAATFFTKNLTELLRTGLPRMPSDLTLDIIFPFLEDQLLRQRLPQPTRMSIGSGGSFVFAQNAAPPETIFNPEEEIQRLREHIAKVEARELELEDRAAEQTLELERLRAQTTITESLAVDQDEGLEAALQEAAEKLAETEAAQAAAQTERERAVAFEKTVTTSVNEPGPVDSPPATDPTSAELPATDSAPEKPRPAWVSRRVLLVAAAVGGAGAATAGIVEALSSTGNRQGNQAAGHRSSPPATSRPTASPSATPAIQAATRWVQKVSTTSEGPSPVISAGGNQVFCASANELYTFDGSSGKETWRHQFSEQIPAEPVLGTSARPVAANGTVYEGSAETLYAFVATSGAIRWTYTAAKLLSGSVAVSSDTVFVGSGDGIYAIDTSAGGLRWQKQIGAVVAGLATSGDLVYARVGTTTYALDVNTGAVKWSAPSGTGQSDLSVGDESVYVTGGTLLADVYSFAAATGKQNWRFHTGGDIHCTPAEANGIVYLGSEDYNIYAVTAKSGQTLWKYTTQGYVYSSPTVADNVLYIGSLDHYVYAIDAESGMLRWRYKMGNQIEAGPITANGIVYSVDISGNLYALTAPT